MVFPTTKYPMSECLGPKVITLFSIQKNGSTPQSKLQGQRFVADADFHGTVQQGPGRCPPNVSRGALNNGGCCPPPPQTSNIVVGMGLTIVSPLLSPLPWMLLLALHLVAIAIAFAALANACFVARHPRPLLSPPPSLSPSLLAHHHCRHSHQSCRRCHCLFVARHPHHCRHCPCHPHPCPLRRPPALSPSLSPTLSPSPSPSPSPLSPSIACYPRCHCSCRQSHRSIRCTPPSSPMPLPAASPSPSSSPTTLIPIAIALPPSPFLSHAPIDS